MKERREAGLDESGSGVKGRKGDRAGWMGEWSEGDKKGKSWIHLGSEGTEVNGSGSGLKERGGDRAGLMGV